MSLLTTSFFYSCDRYAFVQPVGVNSIPHGTPFSEFDGGRRPPATRPFAQQKALEGGEIHYNSEGHVGENFNQHMALLQSGYSRPQTSFS